MIGINISNLAGIDISKLKGGYGMKYSGLPADLKAKFLFLWTGKYDDDNLLNDLDDEVIIVTDKDWAIRSIPETDATFKLPSEQDYIDADDADNFWFDEYGEALEKTFEDLINSETTRTFVKYSDFEPYRIYAIGILKADAVLTEDDEYYITKFFKLWMLYWDDEMRPYGYVKDNRELPT